MKKFKIDIITLCALFALGMPIVIGLANCATPGTSSDVRLILSEAAACETIGNGLQLLAGSGAVAKMDARGRAVLDGARGTARPFCSDPKNPPRNLATASVQLIRAAGQIEALVAAFGK